MMNWFKAFKKAFIQNNPKRLNHQAYLVVLSMVTVAIGEDPEDVIVPEE